MKKCILFFLSFFLILLLDQGSKGLARGMGRVSVNDGVSFGLGSGGGVFLFFVLTFGVLALLFFLFKHFWLKYAWIYGLLSGAAISNLLDRFHFGGVQDFLPIPFVGVQNNLADWVIFFCLVFLVFSTFFNQKPQNNE